MNNYPTSITFRSKTEAIEQLCLKVFNATPIYGTDIEDFKAETSKESSAVKERNEALDIAEKHANRYREIKKQLADEKAHLALIKRERDEARERADTMFAKHADILDQARRERDEAREQRDQLLKQLAATRALADRLEQENADLFLRRWSKAQERAIDAERALRKAWYIMDTIEGNDAVDEWQNKYSKYIESISCPECDALASHGVNDGPCEAHK
jgi:hypothetical protein